MNRMKENKDSIVTRNVDFHC